MAGTRGSGAAASIYAPDRWSQRNQRAEQMFYDQHDREWYGAIELKTGDVVGLLQPQFTAPLIPEQKYLKRVPRRPYDLYIDYDQWQRDEETAIKDWRDEGRKRASKMKGSEYRPGDTDFPEEVLDIIGPKPRAVDPIIAARQGNKWILGLVKNWKVKRDPRLAAFFAEEELDFEIRRQNEPDYSDRYIDRSKPAVGRGGAHGNTEKEIVVPPGRTVPMASNRPRPRAEGKGSGGGKDVRRHDPRPKAGASRQRDGKGHFVKKGEEPDYSETQLAEVG